MALHPPDSPWNQEPTLEQIRSINKAARILGIDIQKIPPTRWEARNLYYDLWGKVKGKGKKR